jgi:D-alanine-D-alanine ligase
MKVVFLHDDLPANARADELDVLVQVEAVSRVLANLGHSSERLAFTLDLGAVADRLRALRPDVVFNLVESVEGRGRLIYLAPALLDALRMPYTGAGAEAMLLTSSKLLTKKLLAAHGVATPPWFALPGPPEAELPVAGRYIIKSVWEEASVGLDDDAIVRVEDADVLRRELRARAGQLGGSAFAELYIEGREFNLALLADAAEPQLLPPAEIQFVDYPAGKPRFVGYRAKWDDQSFEYRHTPRTFDFPPGDADLLAELNHLARECWEVFNLRGYARVDVRVDQSSKPWVLEINANPCLSPDAGFPEAAAQAGLSMEHVVERLLADAQRAAASC